MKTALPLLFTALILQACSPKIKTHLAQSTYQPITADQEILILAPNNIIPENSIFVGDLKIGDTGFSTDCGYQTVINSAKSKAQHSGANIVQLTEVRKPNLGSTCYRIKAKMFRNLDEKIIADLREQKNIKNKSRLPLDADYSVVYFYRPKGTFTGSAIGYKVRLNNDSIIGRVRYGEKFEYRTSNYGQHTFWGVTETKDSVTINIEKGQEYFVRCGINIGLVMGRPEMYIIENNQGIQEFENM